jgi:hypothetical protein
MAGIMMRWQVPGTLPVVSVPAEGSQAGHRALLRPLARAGSGQA